MHFLTCIGSEALDIVVYPVNQDIRGICFASKEEKGRIDKNLSFLADVFLGFIQNMKEICCFILFAHNDKKLSKKNYKGTKKSVPLEPRVKIQKT